MNRVLMTVDELANARDALARQQEIIAFIAFDVGHNYHAMPDGQAEILMEHVEGSVGLMQRVVEWAVEFDAIWESHGIGSAFRENFIGEVGDFACNKIERLVLEAERAKREHDKAEQEVQVRACVQTESSVDWCSEKEADRFSVYTGKPGQIKADADFVDKLDALEWAKSRAMRLGIRFADRIGEL